MKRLLLVEDSKFFGKLIVKEIKAELGFEVAWVETYQATTELFDEWTTDYFIALLDLNLPDATGGQIVELVSSNNIPSIVFTGEVSEKIRDQVWSKGIIDYVLKRDKEDIHYLISLIKRICLNQSIKVMVVEDSSTFRKHICNILNVHQYQLLSAENGRQALDLLQEHPDTRLIITDFNMPEMDGFALTKKVRSGYSRDELAIIGLSAKNDPVLAAQFIKNGANDFITKPFEAEEFYCRVTQNIELIEQVEHRKKAEKELSLAKEQAVLASKMKSEFLANMSHEIRTPMNAIIGLAHLTLDTDLSDKQRDYVNKIQDSADSLLGIINDILDFSKIEAGRLDLESVDFDLDDTLENVASLIAVKAEEKPLEIVLDTASDVPRKLIGDPLRLRQILLNLADNAVKFTESGEIVISTTRASNIDLRQTDKVVLQFSVQDTGIGFSADAIERLFESFSQADGSTTRKYGGTGLGLSICKRLTEMMGGEISLNSEPGKGSTFSFTARFEKNQETRSQRRQLPPRLQGMRALVVNDNASAANMIKNLLLSFGFKTVETDTGTFASINTGDESVPFDMAFLDWRTIGQSGLDKVKAQLAERENTIPILLMVTARDSDDVTVRENEGNVDAFLIKPVDRNSLFNAILEMSGDSSPGKTATASAKKKSTVTEGRLEGRRILLVEDNAINQQIASELLKKEGLHVTVASNGKEALSVLRMQDAAFDAVLMDLQMPEMDGYEATRTIRKDKRFKRLPIIAMTAHAMAGEKEKCLTAGMNDHTTKPIDLKALFECLEKWIHTDNAGSAPDADPSSNQPAIENVKGICIEEVVERLGGNRELAFSIIEEFKTEFGGAGEKLQQFLENGDLRAAERLCHTIKGVAGNMGAKALFHITKHIESNLQKNSVNQARNHLKRFQHALAEIISSIDRSQAQLKKTGARPYLSEQTIEEELTPALIELNVLLRANDFVDDDRLGRLQKLFSGSPCEDGMNRLAGHVASLDYEHAMAELNEIWNVMGIAESLKGVP